MALIQKGMSINCRTQEEIDIFKEVATAEGHFWSNGMPLQDRYEYENKTSFQISCYGNRFPNDVMYASVDFQDSRCTQVEASELFRNQLISRRIKHENMGTE